MSNPAYVKWIEMVKGTEEKMVHPGNVQNHLNAGWSFKNPADAEQFAEGAPAQTGLTTADLTGLIIQHQEESAAAADPDSAEAKKAAKKAAAEAKKAAKQAAAEAKRAAETPAEDATQSGEPAE